MFYMNHSLVSSKEPNSWFADNPIMDDDELIQQLTSVDNDYGNYIKDGTFTPGKPFIEVIKNESHEKAYITLRLPFLKGKTLKYTANLATVTICTTSYNCGSIHVSNLYQADGYHTHLAWNLLNHVEKWCQWCGYTMLFGNVAGYNQIKLLPKFLSRGWTEMGVRYKNARSRNVNIWLQKIIQDQDSIEEENDGETYDDEDNEDEDF